MPPFPDGGGPAAPAASLPPWLASVGRVAGHVLVGTLAWLFAFMGAMTAQARVEAAGTEWVLAALGQVWTGLAIALSFLMPVLVVLRRRYPRVAWDLGVAQAAFPLGPIMAFALPAFLRRAGSRAMGGAIALHAAGLAVFFAFDSRGATPNTSFLRMLTSGASDLDEPVGLNLGAVVTLYALVVAVPVVLGLALRYRDQLQESRRHLADSREDLAERGASLGRMEDELTRREEREMMAREIHDVIGHRLSMINVYAGGLELAAADDLELADKARLVREASQQTVDDLRSLVQVMRDPRGFAGRRPGGSDSLADVVGMIETVLGAGRPLSSSVMIDRAEDAPPVLVHAVYRILQELLTNTQKHAADAPVRVRVGGGPGRGIDLEVANPLPRGSDARWAAPSGGTDGNVAGGAGLAGVRERAAALGGSVSVVPGPTEFVVRVHLPWHTAGYGRDGVRGGR